MGEQGCVHTVSLSGLRSVNKLQGKLILPEGSGGLADDVEEFASELGIRRAPIPNGAGAPVRYTGFARVTGGK
jgi:hypothetical protein